jgi:hypothetical protein
MFAINSEMLTNNSPMFVINYQMLTNIDRLIN